MSLGSLRPEEAAQRLVELSADVRCAVLVDPAGGLVAASEPDRYLGRRLAGLVHELVATADAASGGPTDAVEAHTVGGAVFVARDARFALGCVARRLALPALVLYDLRQALRALAPEGGDGRPSPPPGGAS